MNACAGVGAGSVMPASCISGALAAASASAGVAGMDVSGEAGEISVVVACMAVCVRVRRCFEGEEWIQTSIAGTRGPSAKSFAVVGSASSISVSSGFMPFGWPCGSAIVDSRMEGVRPSWSRLLSEVNWRKL